MLNRHRTSSTHHQLKSINFYPPLLENLHPQGGVKVVVGLQNFYPPLLKIFGAFGADYDDNYNRLWYTHNHASAAGENFELLASEMMIFYWIFSEKPQNFSPQAPLAQALDNFYPPLLDRPHPQGGGKS